MDERQAMLDELADLRVRMAALEARLTVDDPAVGPEFPDASVHGADALAPITPTAAATDGSATTHGPENPITPYDRNASPRTDRRGALKWAGVAAAGLAGGTVLASAGPASAANGDPLILGSTTNTATGPTKLTVNDSSGAPSLEVVVPGFGQQAIRGVAGGPSAPGVGVEGDGGSGTGVIGKGGFYGVDASGGFAGVRGRGGTAGAGVVGESDTAAALAGYSIRGIGLKLDTPQSHSIRFMGPGLKPISGTWQTGDLVAGNGGMWFCYSGGPAATAKWVELSAPALLMNRTNPAIAMTVLDAADTAVPIALKVSGASASGRGIVASGGLAGIAGSSPSGLAVGGVTSSGAALAGGTSGPGGIGLRLEGTGGPSIRFDTGATVPPASGTWVAGDVVGSPSGLWFCYAGGVGPASRWSKVSSALVTLPVPVRVYDSRRGLVPVAVGPKIPLVAATARTVDCKGNSSGVPSGASSVLLNVVVTNTAGNGFLAVYKNGVAYPNTSNLNWAAGQSIAVTTVSSTDTQSRVAVWASSTTDVIVDVIGFYP